MNNSRASLACLSALTLLAAAPARADEPMPIKALDVSPGDLKWMPVAALPPGAELAIVYGTPSQPGPFAYRIKFPPNYRVPVHSHTDSRFYTYLSGTFYEADGDKWNAATLKPYGVGAFQSYVAKTNHYGMTKDEGTIFQVHGYGPTALIYADPAEDPRKK